MSDLRDRAGNILDSASSLEGVRGAIIATRDGLPALGDLNAGDVDTVAAMAAAALAALETAALETGAGNISHMEAQCEATNLLVGGLDDQYLLVLVTAGDASAAYAKVHGELQTVLAE